MEANRMNPALIGLACLIGGLIFGFIWGKA